MKAELGKRADLPDLVSMDLAARLDGILFYGDPHGQWEPLLDALDTSVRSIIILGDLAEAKHHPHQVDEVRRVLKELSARGIDWHTISGNHDSDTAEICDLVYRDLGDRLLDGRVVHVGKPNIAIAGLGGVVSGRIWDGVNKAAADSPEALLAITPRQEHHRGGLPFKKRRTIFPSTVRELSGQKADVLISHEAPSCHPHGFAFINELAEAMGARLIVHGHHHAAYEDQLENGVLVRGLGLAEVWRPQTGLSDVQRTILRAGLVSLDENEDAYRALKSR